MRLIGEKLGQLLKALDAFLMVVSVIALLSVIGIVTIDVVLRYLFNHPLGWSYDVIGLYLMAAVFFLSLPDSLRSHSHVSVDVLTSRIPIRIRHAIEAGGYGATAVLFAFLLKLTWERLVVGFVNREMFQGAVSLPSWVAQAPVAVGVCVFILHCLIRSLAHLISVGAAESWIRFPSSAINQEEFGE